MPLGSGTRYVWFERAVVVRSEAGFGCECLVDGKRVPLPAAILHPDCTLEKIGDEDRFGVPEFWAIEHGSRARPSKAWTIRAEEVKKKRRSGLTL
jgi:hypothetical protein